MLFNSKLIIANIMFIPTIVLAQNINANLKEFEYLRPESNKGAAGFAKFRSLSVDTASIGIAIDNGRVFDSKIYMNHRYLSFVGQNHQLGFSVNEEKTLEFADLLNVKNAILKLRKTTFSLLSDSISFLKGDYGLNLYNFNISCSAYPRKYFSDPANIYFGCLNEATLTDNNSPAKIEASMKWKDYGVFSAESELKNTEVTTESISTNLVNTEIFLNGESIAKLKDDVEFSCKKDSDVINQSIDHLLKRCLGTIDATVPNLSMNGTVKIPAQGTFKIKGNINTINAHTEEKILYSNGQFQADINGIKSNGVGLVISCEKDQSIGDNISSDTIAKDCLKRSAASLDRIRVNAILGVQKIPVSVYLNDGELKVFGRSVDLASKDLSVGYKDYAFRISDVDLHCLNQVDNKLGLETFDSSCGRNAQLKPLQSITKDYSIMTIEIPSGDTENPYIVRSGIYEASVKDGRISGNLGRTKVSIATDKDVYLNSIVGNCVRGDISMISDPQGVLETCLSDLNIEKNHLLFFNEIDHSRYYAEINSIKLYQNKLTLDLPGIQIKNQNPNSTSMNFLDLKVDCFREKNHNPLSYQEQINFCLKEGEVHLDKVVMPTRKKDVADLYEIYESIMKSPKLEVKNSPIDQIRQVKEKVKDISVYIKDGVIKLSAKVKLLGAWKLIKFEAQVIKHDFETKQIVVKRLSANLPPVILNTGIKMAIPESLIQVDHDQYTIQYY